MKPEIVANYVETGKVYFVWRHLPILGASARRAAHASACAHEQDAFWPFHDQVYADQETMGAGALQADHLRGIAESLELDVAAYDGCTAEGRYTAAVDQDRSQALEQRYFRTPAFVVDERPVIFGVFPFQEWDAALQGLLDEGEAAVQ